MIDQIQRAYAVARADELRTLNRRISRLQEQLSRAIVHRNFLVAEISDAGPSDDDTGNNSVHPFNASIEQLEPFDYEFFGAAGEQFARADG